MGIERIVLVLISERLLMGRRTYFLALYNIWHRSCSEFSGWMDSIK